MGRASRDGSMASSEDQGSLSGATSVDATVDSAITGATSEVVRHFNFEDQDHERATSAGGKFNFEETIGAADYRFTGDMSMYNDRNMRTRRRLRKEPKIRAWLMTFFNTFAVDRLKRQHMYDFEMCCCKAIFASSAFSMDEAVEAVEADLEHDFHHEMTAEDFSDSLFETVDMWTASVDIDEYVEFLRCLYLRITYEDDHGTRKFRDVEDVVALDMRDKRSEVPLGDMPPDTDDKVKLAKLCRRMTKRHDDSDSDAREDSDDGDDAEHRDSFRAEPAPPPLRRRNSVQRPSRRASVSSIHLKHRHSDRGAHLRSSRTRSSRRRPRGRRGPRRAGTARREPRAEPEPRRTQPPPRENRKTDYELYGTDAYDDGRGTVDARAGGAFVVRAVDDDGGDAGYDGEPETPRGTKAAAPRPPPKPKRKKEPARKLQTFSRSSRIDTGQSPKVNPKRRIEQQKKLAGKRRAAAQLGDDAAVRAPAAAARGPRAAATPRSAPGTPRSRGSRRGTPADAEDRARGGLGDVEPGDGELNAYAPSPGLADALEEALGSMYEPARGGDDYAEAPHQHAMPTDPHVASATTLAPRLPPTGASTASLGKALKLENEERRTLQDWMAENAPPEEIERIIKKLANEPEQPPPSFAQLYAPRMLRASVRRLTGSGDGALPPLFGGDQPAPRRSRRGTRIRDALPRATRAADGDAPRPSPTLHTALDDPASPYNLPHKPGTSNQGHRDELRPPTSTETDLFKSGLPPELEPLPRIRRPERKHRFRRPKFLPVVAKEPKPKTTRRPLAYTGTSIADLMRMPSLVAPQFEFFSPHF
ncbi:hypothetical protein JL721_3805 [Aureococcus anophagefferens]|nr:hypothetical protein JL721_3805 [Aureococcus anophagefferens]